MRYHQTHLVWGNTKIAIAVLFSLLCWIFPLRNKKKKGAWGTAGFLLFFFSTSLIIQVCSTATFCALVQPLAIFSYFFNPFNNRGGSIFALFSLVPITAVSKWPSRFVLNQKITQIVHQLATKLQFWTSLRYFNTKPIHYNYTSKGSSLSREMALRAEHSHQLRPCRDRDVNWANICSLILRNIFTVLLIFSPLTPAKIRSPACFLFEVPSVKTNHIVLSLGY